MLMPQELKDRTFHLTLRGYSPAEVDEYVDFVVEKYEALYRENDERERKLAAALKALEALRARETTIKSLEAEMRRAAAAAAEDAAAEKQRAAAEAEAYAARVRAEADEYVAEQRRIFEQMRAAVLAFRDTLYGQYNAHIDLVESLAETAKAAAFPAGPAEDEEAGKPAEASDEFDELISDEPAGPAEDEEAGEPAEEADEFDELISDEPAGPAEDEEAGRSAEEADEFDELISDEPAGPAEDEEAGEPAEEADEFDELISDEPADPAEDEEAGRSAKEADEFDELISDEPADPAEEKEAGEPAENGDEELDDDEILASLSSLFGKSEETTIQTPEEAAPAADEADRPDDAPERKEAPAGELDDDILLQDLRQAFHVEFETFRAKKDKKKEEEEEYRFVSEPGEAPKKLSGIFRKATQDDGES